VLDRPFFSDSVQILAPWVKRSMLSLMMKSETIPSLRTKRGHCFLLCHKLVPHVRVFLFTMIFITLVTGLICTPGQYFCTPFTKCCDCTSGLYSTTYNASVCVQCTIGTNAVSGSSSCFDCPGGKYSSSDASGSCTSCSGGLFAAGTGSSVCLTCGPGNSASGGKSIKGTTRFGFAWKPGVKQ
jgi:hypothetical protein